MEFECQPFLLEDKQEKVTKSQSVGFRVLQDKVFGTLTPLCVVRFCPDPEGAD